MRGRILVVEDDEDILENLRLFLEGEGYRVDVALNGRAALEILARADPLPSVILLDLMMPVMNGAAFHHAQLADPRIAPVPVILMTADGNATRKAKDMGVAGAIGKPFGIEDLLCIVKPFAP